MNKKIFLLFKNHILKKASTLYQHSSVLSNFEDESVIYFLTFGLHPHNNERDKRKIGI